MSVSIYGSSGGQQSSTVNKAYVDSKFVTLVQNLETKLDKKITTDLNMYGHRINQVLDPIQDTDVSNKSYVDKKIYYAIQDMEKRNAKLLADDINTKKLISICSPVYNIIMKYSEEFSSKYGEQFNKKYIYLQNIILKYIKLYNNEEINSDVEEILSTYITDLKCLLIAIIEELSRKLFVDLKTYLVRTKLMTTPEEGTPLMKIRRFISKFVRDLDPDRKNFDLELLLQKNLMFIDLGLHYVSDSLLEQF